MSKKMLKPLATEHRCPECGLLTELVSTTGASVECRLHARAPYMVQTLRRILGIASGQESQGMLQIADLTKKELDDASA